MSILIKGLSMPKECEYCMFAGFSGAANEYYVCMLNGKWKDRNRDGRMESCPLIEIPPHGRLIDADKFMKPFRDLLEENEHNLDYYSVGYGGLSAMIDDAPTVIESEEQEHE